MTAPTLPADTGVLGPGTLKIGETAALIDVSCYLNNAAIEGATEVGDSTTKMCGAVRKGKVDTTFTLTGNIDVDAGNDAGFFAMSWEQAGEEVDFQFTPNTELGTQAAGKLVLTPLRFGADEYGADLTSDFTFDCVGKPTLTFVTVP